MTKKTQTWLVVIAVAFSLVDYSCYAGASAFLSTPSDLVRFAMAINGGKLLQPAHCPVTRDLTAAAGG